MIHYIKGYVSRILPGKIILENNGMGFEINVTDNLAADLAKSSDMVTVYTFMAVAEDDISLYGFSDEESLSLFKLLTSVSGVGNKVALAILSKLSVSELKRAIVFEDADSIAKAKGVGKKTAAKLVLELKDKIDDIDVSEADLRNSDARSGSAKSEAIMALQSLGYSRSEAMSALVGVNDDTLTTEEYIKIALRSGR